MTSKFRPAGSGWAIIVLSADGARARRLRPQGPARSAADRLQRVHGQRRSADRHRDRQPRGRRACSIPTYGADAAPAARQGQEEIVYPRPAPGRNPHSWVTEPRHEPFRLSQRRAARRGGEPVRAGRSRRHAVLLLFDRDAGAALPRLRRRLRRREGAGLLRHEGEFQPVGAAHAGQARRRRRRGLRRRIEARAGRRHSRRARSCSPASARPRPSCAPRSPPTSSASTSNPSPSSNCCRGLRPRRARPRASRCASIPTSMPARTPRSRPASPRTSSAFRSRMPARSMPAPQSCRASRSPASTCISAARSPISADGDRVPHPRRIRADAARRRPQHLACRFRRRARHSLLHGPRGAAGARRLCRDGQARHATISAAR